MTETTASPRFLDLIPREFAREHLVLGERAGAGVEASSIILAHGPATDALVLHNVRTRLGVAGGGVGTASEAAVEAEAIARRIDEAYGAHELGVSERTAAGTRADREGIPTIELGEGDAGSSGAGEGDLEEELKRLGASGERDLLSLGDKGPVVRLVDAVLFDAIGRGASDIHIQPLADSTLIRVRVDGVLLTARRVHPRLTPAIVSRIKVMARLDVAERRAPQDGRATVTIGRRDTISRDERWSGESRAIDLRIATLPSAYGERVVIRLLDTQQGKSLSTLDAVGMPPEVAAAYRDRAGRSSGIVLVTGPTGSGKTTTLYATLRWIASMAGWHGHQRRASGMGAVLCARPGSADSTPVNILTIEDPIEYDLSSLNDGTGADARSGGGCLPISQTQVDARKGLTFATGLRHILRQDPDVIMVGEIRDLETARTAIQASLTGHLVFSTLHTADAPGAVTRLLDLGIEPYLVASSLSCVLAQRLVRLTHGACAGEGCGDCLHSGFKGRRGIFELLVLDAAIREMISQHASAAVIRDAAIARGMKRLEDQGAEMARAGMTTLEEVRRVTLGAEG